MNKLTTWIIVCVCSSHLVHAQMYDPFHKTAKPRAASISGLLPPPLMVIPEIPQTVVSAVMNNKAFINGAWYGVGDRVNNHEVTYIQNNFVGLKEGNRLTMIAVGGTRRVLGTKEVP
ncbi:MAG: hypothetical protein PHQ22_01260 [Sulfuricurvum sp.]|nr:hypothetical protein [Sulfuricurvum sp.]